MLETRQHYNDSEQAADRTDQTCLFFVPADRVLFPDLPPHKFNSQKLTRDVRDISSLAKAERIAQENAKRQLKKTKSLKSGIEFCTGAGVVKSHGNNAGVPQ